MRPYWIAIWILFNPFTIVVLIFAVCLVIYNVASSPWKEKQNQIQQTLVPLCSETFCVIDKKNTKQIEFSFKNVISYHNFKDRFDIEKNNFSTVSFLAFLDDFYYFLFENKGSSNKGYYIGRTDINLDTFELVFSIEGEIETYDSGYDSKMYYCSNSRYYVFDFYKLILNEVPIDSEEAKVLMDNGLYYKNKNEFIDGVCRIDESVHLLSSDYSADFCMFDEQLIDDIIYTKIKEFGFTPKRFFSIKTGFVYIVYCGNPDLDFWYDCLVVEYDEKSQKALGYQMFDNINFNSYKFFPRIHFKNVL